MSHNKIILSAVLLLFVIFFGRLFYPEPSIFLTPESVRSDMWHFHYPLKDLLHQHLAQGKIPLWHSGIATGFPILAEGHIQIFFIPNLILFAIFPTWIAWNLYFLFISLISLTGVYLFLRTQKISFSTSLTTGTIFSFSGFFIMHYIHPNTLAAAALLPWVFYTRHLWLSQKRWYYVLGFIIILWQQLVTGAPQIVFATIIGLLSFEAIRAYLKPTLLPRFFPLGLAIFLALGLAASQLLPTLELIHHSTRAQGTQEIFRFPYPFRYLLLFLHPFLFGSPKDGTFPLPEDEHGIFAESVFYIGLIALVISINQVWIHRKNKKYWPWLGLMLIGLLLGLGELLPTKIIFDLPGFNYFRVPQRYILLAVWGLVWFLALGLEGLRKKYRSQPAIITGVLLILLLDIILMFSQFHPAIPISQALKQPDITKSIPPNIRVWTHSSIRLNWYQHFQEHGWQDPLDYLHYTPSMEPINNLLWDVTHTGYYTGLYTKRMTMLQALHEPQLLDLTSTEYIITAIPTQQIDSWQLVSQLDTPQTPFYLYHNTAAPPRVRLAQHVITQSDLDLIPAIILSEQFNASSSAILETPLSFDISAQSTGSAEITNESHTELEISVTTDSQTLLIIADSYYPGWKALVNDDPVEIIPVNYNQRGIIVPSGSSTVLLKYIPQSLYQGIIVSGTSIMVIIGIMCWPKSRRWMEKFNT